MFVALVVSAISLFTEMQTLAETEVPPLVVQTRPVFDMDDGQFFEFCQINSDLQIERNAQGEIIIMAPAGGSTSSGEMTLTQMFANWSEKDGTGEIFGSSGGFILPDGATRSPDISWVRGDRLDALSDEEWDRFLPLCPDFVLELRSPTDSLTRLKKKMEEYRDNGAQLGWLLDPKMHCVFIYRPCAEVEMRENPESLSGEPLLKGFALDVPAVWRAIERKCRRKAD